MEIKTKITKKEAAIFIKLEKRKSKLEPNILIDAFKARQELLKKHPELNLTRKPTNLHHIDNMTDNLQGEWIFPIIIEKKDLKKTKDILKFKAKTTEPIQDSVLKEETISTGSVKNSDPDLTSSEKSATIEETNNVVKDTE